MYRKLCIGLSVFLVFTSLSTSSLAAFNGDGRYRIMSRLSGKALDIDSKSTADGANVQVWSYNGGTNQQFDIASVGGGYYSIRPVHSGKAVEHWNNCTSTGCNVVQYSYWGNSNQQWQISSVGSGYYKIRSRQNGMAMDVWNRSTSDGADVRLYTDNGGSNQQWSFESVSGSSSSSSSSSGGSGSSSSGGISGSSCNGGSTTTVNSTIRVEDGGTFDGGCRTYTAGSALGDGSQSESQDPIFRVGPGLVRNVYIGSNGADGIHSRNGGDVDNIHWSDVGEDAFTVKDPTNGGSVSLRNIEGYKGSDKYLQVNDDVSMTVDNCIVDNMGKFLRQNGGKTFPISVNVSNCQISNMKEGIFRSDSPNSTARITNSRLHNAGSICIGSWRSCSSSGITYY